MITKIFIPKINFDPELGKKQKIQILLTQKNELPQISILDDIQKKYEVTAETGTEFYQDTKTQYVFANIPSDLDNSLPNLHFSFFTELNPDNCADYIAIKKAIIKLGYEF